MRRGRAGLAVALGLGLGLGSSLAACRRADPGPGRRLFQGEVALRAQLRDDDVVLPADAWRCDNCHVSRPGQGDAGRPFGPTLTGGTLTTTQRRRGGPPSRYDAASLCTLLRTGVDPAGVLIERVMPRYRIDDAGCTALWDYLQATR